MRIVIVGASGNAGTALLRRLGRESGIDVLGVARRAPSDQAGPPYDRIEWQECDVGAPGAADRLAALFAGADAVVHLAWALQPGRDPQLLHRVNVDGTRRVAEAARRSGVAQFVHMSSLGAYAAGSRHQVAGEDWPVTGIPSSQYSRDKSDAERLVRRLFGPGSPTTLTVVRPTLVLQPEAASEIGRYFLGPLVYAGARLVPGAVARLVPLPLPDVRVGFVHADDVADALVRMLDRRAAGPFNLSAEPVLDADDIARALGCRRVPVPAAALRPLVAAAFAAHLIPTEPGWFDLGIGAPALDTTRARTVLDWLPAHRGDDVLTRFVAALGAGEGAPGALLAPAGGPRRDPAEDPSAVPPPTGD
jgi:UDP-glucose 4-epimerase